MEVLHALIEAVADAKDKEPDELGIVLEDHVSTEAIERLDEHDNDAWTLEFELPNHAVRIVGDGTVLVDGIRKQSSA